MSSSSSSSSAEALRNRKQQQLGGGIDVLQEDNKSTTTDNSNNVVVVPSYRQLMVFVSTTVLIWLSEPLLSLVDTTVVGRSSNILELAALGPATMLIDSTIYLTYFLAIATTNVMAKSFAKSHWESLQKHASQVLGVAAVLGVMVIGIIFVLGKSLLTSWVTTTSSSDARFIVNAAFAYAKTRSIVAPLVIMDMVAQSICLATLDTKTPAIAVAVASIVNIVGDVWLVSYLKQGIVGAALATAVASASSAIVLLTRIKRKMQQWKRMQNEEEEAMEARHVDVAVQEELLENLQTSEAQAIRSKSDETASEEEAVNARAELPKEQLQAVQPNNITIQELGLTNEGLGAHELEEYNIKPRAEHKEINGKGSVDSQELAVPANDTAVTKLDSVENSNKSSSIPFISLPDRKSFWKLTRLSGPIFFVIVGKVVCYSAMTLRATDLGVLSLASHNVMMRVFFFFTTFGDGLSQAAQSFVPQALFGEPKQSKKHIQQLLTKLGLLSTYVGIANSQVAGWILRNCGSYFTKDVAIQTTMATYNRYMTLSLLVHPFIMLFEGSIVATRDLAYLVGTYAVTMALLMAQLKFACVDFAGVWKALFVFQLLRLIQFSTRFFHKTVSSGRDSLNINKTQ